MSTIWKLNLDNPLEFVAGKYAQGRDCYTSGTSTMKITCNPPEPVSLVRMGTGGKINNSDLLGEYLGTVQNDNGLVWHFFVVADQLSLGDGNESYE